MVSGTGASVTSLMMAMNYVACLPAASLTGTSWTSNLSEGEAKSRLVLERSTFARGDLNDVALDTAFVRMGSHIDDALVVAGDSLFLSPFLRKEFGGLKGTDGQGRFEILSKMTPHVVSHENSAGKDGGTPEAQILRLSVGDPPHDPHLRFYSLFQRGMPPVVFGSMVFAEPGNFEFRHSMVDSGLKMLANLMEKLSSNVSEGNDVGAMYYLDWVKGVMLKLEADIRHNDSHADEVGQARIMDAGMELMLGDAWKRISDAQVQLYGEGLGDMAGREDSVVDLDVISHPDEIEVYREALQSGVPELLHSLIFLYREASLRPLLNFDKMYHSRLDEVRRGLSDLTRYSERVERSDIKLVDFQPKPYAQALREIEKALPYYEKVKIRGFTHSLASRIRMALIDIARHLDESWAVMLEKDLEVKSGPAIHPKTATMSQFQGALLGAAGGDAWAAPYENLTAEEMAGRPLDLAVFERRGNRPAGSWTDDTLMTQAALEAMLQEEAIVPRVIGKKFSELEPRLTERGFGLSGKIAVKRLAKHRNWKDVGDDYSMGNGAAMRILPVALFDYRSLEALRRDVVLTAQITHRSYEPVAGAMAVAFMVAKILRQEFDPTTIIPEARVFVGPSRFSSQLGKAHGFLQAGGGDPLEVMGELGTEGLVWESVVSAIYAFLATPESFEETLKLVARAGGDTDTMATIAGAMSGALNGIDALPQSWKRDVEEAETIVNRAFQLFHVVHSFRE